LSGDLIAVRLRAGCVAIAAVLAAVLLAGCGGSNVGIAAKVNGHQITESQLSDFVTPKAQGIDLTGQGQLTPPKPFVLYILISEQVYRVLLQKTGGVPSPGRVSALINSYVGNSTPQRAVASFGVHGYAPAFAQEILRYRALNSILGERVRSGIDVRGALQHLHLPVVINPRYGTWDAKRLVIVTEPSAGLPGYLRLQPTAAALNNAG
jgi:hypothetical protein